MGPIRALYHAVRLRRGPSPIGPLLKAARSLQWASPEEIRAVQSERLREAMVFAAARIPLYRRRFAECGLDSSALRSLPSLEALARLPPLSRQDMRAHGSELADPLAPPADRIARHTGGSTGEPTPFLLDGRDVAAARAEMLLHFEWIGLVPGVRHAFLWGADRDSWPYRGLRGAIKRRVERLVWINTFDLAEEELRAVVSRLHRFRPRVLVGYASSLAMFAEHCLATGASIPSIAAIQSSAETLDPRKRAILAEAFRAPVFDRYGSREFGNVAHECTAHCGLHVSAGRLHVEIVGDDDRPAAPGEVGRVLVTTLLRRTMPLLRYEIGDLAAALDSTQRCACGRGLPRIGAIRGRVSDVIRGPSGRLLHGEFFTHLFYGVPGVARFQVVQEDARRLVVSVVAGGGAPADLETRLRRRILEEGDPGFDVEFRFPQAIRPGPTGKHRFTLSRLSTVCREGGPARVEEPAAASEDSRARST
jgi:phenylacetate-CoA ligase